MVTIKTTYEQVLQDYPEVVQEFLDNLRNSTSKNKDMDITKIKWYYAWGTFNKKLKTEADKILREEDFKKRFQLNYDERWENESAKIKVEITMEAGSFLRGDRCQKEGIPPFIERYAKELLKVQMTAEQDALSKEGLSNQNVIDSVPELNKEIIEEIFPPKKDLMDLMNGMMGGEPQQGQQTRKPRVSFDLDDILDKIHDSGMDSLSDEEKDFLNNQSE